MSVYIVTRKNGKAPTTYHVRWSRGKYEPYVYLGSLDTKKRAEMRKHKVLDLLAQGIEPTLTMFKHTAVERLATLKFGEVADSWMDAQVQWEPKTRSKRKSYVTLVVAYFDARRDPLSIGSDDVRKYIGDMTAEGLKGSTQAARLSALTGILDHAKHPDNPVRDKAVKRVKIKSTRRPMPTIAQLAAIRSHLCERDQRIFDVLEHTGMRVSEATSMTWAEVDSRQRRLVGRGTKSFERVIPVLAGQPDWLPVKPEDAKPSDRVFPVASDTFAQHLRDASAEAGDFHLNPNQLRHVHASRLLAGAKGGGIETDMGPADMAYRMGHTVPIFLKTYTHRIPPEA